MPVNFKALGGKIDGYFEMIPGDLVMAVVGATQNSIPFQAFTIVMWEDGSCKIVSTGGPLTSLDLIMAAHGAMKAIKAEVVPE